MRQTMAFAVTLVLCAATISMMQGCTDLRRPAQVEAVSVLGWPLYSTVPATDKRVELERRLCEAEAMHRANPHDEQAIIWHGRRLAYLGRFNDAVEVFTAGLRVHPDSHGLLRHRGHRYITLRRFGEAINDLEHAAALIQGLSDEVEPDGALNARNQPRSTIQGNIFYHLALARYLIGDFAGADAAWREGLTRATNDDMKVAVLHWLHLSLRRQGRDDEAHALLSEVRADMEVFENVAYHRLLLMYRGELTADSLMDGLDVSAIQGQAIGYGVGCWHLCNGDQERAMAIFERMTGGNAWPAFGFIAAEVELARAGAVDRRPAESP